MEKVKAFSIRVYGLLTNTRGELLLSSEYEYGKAFTKFPGGGVELGEGLYDALVREFVEETGNEIVPGDLIHLNHHFVQSMFNPAKQVLLVHYRCSWKDHTVVLQTQPIEQVAPEKEGAQVFHWVDPTQAEKYLSFPTDVEALRKFLLNN